MRYLRYLLILVSLIFSSFAFASAPSVDSIGGANLGYNLNVSKGSGFIDNVRNLFFPSNNSGQIWVALRNILVGLLIFFFVYAGLQFILHASDEGELKKAKMNLLYIFYGAFLIFASTWILGTILHVGGETTTASTILQGTKSDILVNILVFFKTLAYYAAFVMMVYYGYKIMQAQEKEDKIKAGKTGVLNVILALIAIKVLDYLYYIAQQSDFKSQAQSFLTSTGKLLGWILGVVIVLALLYAGILLVTSRGNEEAWKKSKTIIRNVFLVIFVVFLFIIIVYDMVKNINF